MKRVAWFRAGFRWLVAGWVLLLATASSAADEGLTLPFTPLQLAIVPGFGQLFSKATPVYGLRASAIYGMQSKVVGLDAGLFNDSESLTGLGVGLCNVTRGNAVGAHLSAGVNYVETDFAGFQTGLANQVAGKLAGFQLGLANDAEEGTGLQIGIINQSRAMRGLQLGLINRNGKGLLPFFPIVNFGY